ncbi:MAG: hypothetical protein R6W73_09880, partial [Candidatus Saliniplasma sp.]
ILIKLHLSSKQVVFMMKLYYGTEDEDGNIPGNVIEEGKLVSSVLIPSKDLSDRKKPGEMEIEEEGILEDAVPDEWVIDLEDMDPERKDDGSIVLKGICPDCSN